ncbi:MAG: hypothetical protein PUB20_03745 [Clostridia bacterium]|nr:hypothetical protein [Clostridia bacterium]
MKIINRIVTFLLAASVFPITFCMVFVRILVSISEDSSLYTLLSTFMKETLNSRLELDFSIKELFGYIQDGKFTFAGMTFDSSSIPEGLIVAKGWLIASAVLLVIALLIALVIMGCALFTKAHKTVMCLSAGGAVSMFAAMCCFNRFGKPYVTGAVNIGKILSEAMIGDDGGLLGSIGSSVLDGAINIDIFQLGNFAVTVLIVFLALLTWSGAYYLTMPRENQKGM